MLSECPCSNPGRRNVFRVRRCKPARDSDERTRLRLIRFVGRISNINCRSDQPERAAMSCRSSSSTLFGAPTVSLISFLRISRYRSFILLAACVIVPFFPHIGMVGWGRPEQRLPYWLSAESTDVPDRFGRIGQSHRGFSANPDHHNRWADSDRSA